MHRHWILSVLGFAAGVSLLLGGLVMSWWSYADGGLTVSIGLREAQMCRADQAADACTTVTLQRLSSSDSVDWLRAGTGSYAAAWMAAILSLAMAGMATAGKRSLLLTRTTLVAAASAAVAGGLFLVWVPADLARQPDLGMALYFAGAVLAAVCGILALRGGPGGAQPEARPGARPGARPAGV
jgi:hypothetical protein